MKTDIFMLYIQAVVVVIACGILFGGIIPALISDDSWTLPLIGISILVISIPVLVYIVISMGKTGVKLYKDITKESGK